MVSHSEQEPDTKEVWFAGCHTGNLLLLYFSFIMTQMISTDIGGGAVTNDVEQSLANIPLRWMLREIFASGLGHIFDSSALARANINLGPKLTTYEMELDSTDAVEPINDRMYSAWWLLEILPFPYSFQDMENVWQTSFV